MEIKYIDYSFVPVTRKAIDTFLNCLRDVENNSEAQTMDGIACCEICKEHLTGRLGNKFINGGFQWHFTLDHYVDKHGAIPPMKFVRFILRY